MRLKSGKRIIFGNIPEPTQSEAEERKKHDEERVDKLLKELGAEQLKPTKVIRVGQKGRYPRKALAIFSSVAECEKVLEKAEQVTLSNDIFIMRDRTYNQREEARLFRLEKEREEKMENGAGADSQRENNQERTPSWQN